MMRAVQHRGCFLIDCKACLRRCLHRSESVDSSQKLRHGSKEGRRAEEQDGRMQGGQGRRRAKGLEGRKAGGQQDRRAVGQVPRLSASSVSALASFFTYFTQVPLQS